MNTEFNTTCNTRIADLPGEAGWALRQARAVIPFEVVNGLPINPLAPAETLPAGQGELWHWGEAVATDAIVFATGPDQVRRLLMIERGDRHGWAVPGGGLDAGETPRAGVARELAEETGLVIDPARFDMQPGRGVPDPRQGVHAWMVTIPGVIDLGPVRELPQVTAADDAADAAWIPATTFPALLAALDARGGRLFPAHTDLLRDLLNGHA